MNESANYRHEIKYRCSQEQLYIIKSRLDNLLTIDTHALNGQYNIRSMYFDNYGNRCFYENENGIDPREKYRIRIYNSDDARILLECKQKERSKTHKTSCLLSSQDYDEILKGGSFDKFSQKNELLRKFTLLLKTQMFRPKVIVEYERIPYVYSNGNVRITLDTNIRSSNAYQNFFDAKIPARLILPTDQHLLEVKYDEYIPDFIKEVLEIGDLQRVAFSKYYLCRKFSLGGL